MFKNSLYAYERLTFVSGAIKSEISLVEIVWRTPFLKFTNVEFFKRWPKSYYKSKQFGLLLTANYKHFKILQSNIKDLLYGPIY